MANPAPVRSPRLAPFHPAEPFLVVTVLIRVSGFVPLPIPEHQECFGRAIAPHSGKVGNSDRPGSWPHRPPPARSWRPDCLPAQVGTLKVMDDPCAPRHVLRKPAFWNCPSTLLVNRTPQAADSCPSVEGFQNHDVGLSLGIGSAGDRRSPRPGPGRSEPVRG